MVSVTPSSEAVSVGVSDVGSHNNRSGVVRDCSMVHLGVVVRNVVLKSVVVVGTSGSWSHHTHTRKGTLPVGLQTFVDVGTGISRASWCGRQARRALSAVWLRESGPSSRVRSSCWEGISMLAIPLGLRGRCGPGRGVAEVEEWPSSVSAGLASPGPKGRSRGGESGLPDAQPAA